MDLPASALNRISELIDTQISYCRQLGNYITSTLKVRVLRLVKGDLLNPLLEHNNGPVMLTSVSQLHHSLFS